MNTKTFNLVMIISAFLSFNTIKPSDYTGKLATCSVALIGASALLNPNNTDTQLVTQLIGTAGSIYLAKHIEDKHPTKVPGLTTITALTCTTLTTRSNARKESVPCVIQ